MLDIKKLEDKTGVRVIKENLFRTAFIHKSYVNEHRDEKLEHNERLEFLGDAVLELASTNYLFLQCPTRPEGELTAFRSALVKGEHLAKVAVKLELGQYLFLSNGEEKSGGRTKNYILANTLEALIGAIYLDSGYIVAEKFIKKFVLTNLNEIIDKKLYIDAKSRFQEDCQEKRSVTPHYECLAEDGPDHNKIFTMGAYIGEEKVAEGKGASKQKAEDDAATNALKALKW